MQLTPTLTALLEVFLIVFTIPSFSTFRWLMTGWILSVRHRYVTDLNSCSDSVGNGHFSDYRLSPFLQPRQMTDRRFMETPATLARALLRWSERRDPSGWRRHLVPQTRLGPVWRRHPAYRSSFWSRNFSRAAFALSHGPNQYNLPRIF